MLIAQHAETDYAKRIHLKFGQAIDFDYPCSSQTDCSPYSISLPPGYYYLEAYGASGQTVSSGIGGYGGYSSGVYHLNLIKINL